MLVFVLVQIFVLTRELRRDSLSGFPLDEPAGHGSRRLAEVPQAAVSPWSANSRIGPKSRYEVGQGVARPRPIDILGLRPLSIPMFSSGGRGRGAKALLLLVVCVRSTKKLQGLCKADSA